MAKLYANDRARLAPIVKSSGTTLDFDPIPSAK